jgi:hypothetical protein
MWVKTRERVRFDFGRGVTMSLDNPVTIPLNAHGWTDVALPFQFDMRLGDIVTTTRGGSPDADTALAYRGRYGSYRIIIHNVVSIQPVYHRSKIRGCSPL